MIMTASKYTSGVFARPLLGAVDIRTLPLRLQLEPRWAMESSMCPAVDSSGDVLSYDEFAN